jgi:hypothetical protein
MEVTSIAEQLLFTTVRIEAKTPAERRIGTGFIFNYILKDKNYPFLVTNKHVVSGAYEGLLTFIKSDGQKPLLGESYILEIEDFEKMWFGHKESDIDVTVTPFAPILKSIHNQGGSIFFKAIPNNLVPNEETLKELDAIEEVLFIGYPCGIWDEKNLLPIVRRGITATPVYIDFNGKKQFLIDASVFPGSSGSPVFIYNPGIYWDKKSGSTVVGHRLFFLGILSEVFQMEDTGEIIIPTTTRPIIKLRQLADLGVVFKAQTIIEVIESFLKLAA